MLHLPGLTRLEIGLTLDDDSSSDEDDGRPHCTPILNGTAASSSSNANGSGSPAFAAASATTTTATLPASGPRPNVGEHIEVQWCSPAGNYKWYRGRVLASLGPCACPVIQYTDGDEVELGEDELWRLAPDEIWRITKSAHRLPTAPVLANRRPTGSAASSAEASAASSAEVEAMLSTGPVPPAPVQKAQPPLLHVLSSESTISSSSTSPSPRPDHVDVKDVLSTLEFADGLSGSVGRGAVAVVGGAAGAGTHKRPPGAAPKGANGLKMTWSMVIGKWQESPDLPLRQANSRLDEVTGDGACGAGGAGSSSGVSSSGMRSSGSAVGVHITLRGCFRSGYALDDCAPALKRAAPALKRAASRAANSAFRPQKRAVQEAARADADKAVVEAAQGGCLLHSLVADCGVRLPRNSSAHTRLTLGAAPFGGGAAIVRFSARDLELHPYLFGCAKRQVCGPCAQRVRFTREALRLRTQGVPLRMFPQAIAGWGSSHPLLADTHARPPSVGVGGEMMSEGGAPSVSTHESICAVCAQESLPRPSTDGHAVCYEMADVRCTGHHGGKPCRLAYHRECLERIAVPPPPPGTPFVCSFCEHCDTALTDIERARMDGGYKSLIKVLAAPANAKQPRGPAMMAMPPQPLPTLDCKLRAGAEAPAALTTLTPPPTMLSSSFASATQFADAELLGFGSLGASARMAEKWQEDEDGMQVALALSASFSASFSPVPPITAMDTEQVAPIVTSAALQTSAALYTPVELGMVPEPPSLQQTPQPSPVPSPLRTSHKALTESAVAPKALMLMDIAPPTSVRPTTPTKHGPIPTKLPFKKRPASLAVADDEDESSVKRPAPRPPPLPMARSESPGSAAARVLTPLVLPPPPTPPKYMSRPHGMSKKPWDSCAMQLALPPPPIKSVASWRSREAARTPKAPAMAAAVAAPPPAAAPQPVVADAVEPPPTAPATAILYSASSNPTAMTSATTPMAADAGTSCETAAGVTVSSAPPMPIVSIPILKVGPLLGRGGQCEVVTAIVPFGALDAEGLSGVLSSRFGMPLWNGRGARGAPLNVALKRLVKTSPPGTARRLEWEAAILARASRAGTPHVLPLLGWDAPRAHLFLPLCGAGSVTDALRSRSADPDLLARYALLGLCRALEQLHGPLRVAHRDVKLDNLLLMRPAKAATGFGPDDVVLTDFGFSLAAGINDNTSAAADLPATLPFTAPEVLERRRERRNAYLAILDSALSKPLSRTQPAKQHSAAAHEEPVCEEAAHPIEPWADASSWAELQEALTSIRKELRQLQNAPMDSLERARRACRRLIAGPQAETMVVLLDAAERVVRSSEASLLARIDWYAADVHACAMAAWMLFHSQLQAYAFPRFSHVTDTATRECGIEHALISGERPALNAPLVGTSLGGAWTRLVRDVLGDAWNATGASRPSMGRFVEVVSAAVAI